MVLFLDYPAMCGTESEATAACQWRAGSFSLGEPRHITCKRLLRGNSEAFTVGAGKLDCLISCVIWISKVKATNSNTVVV